MSLCATFALSPAPGQQPLAGRCPMAAQHGARALAERRRRASLAAARRLSRREGRVGQPPAPLVPWAPVSSSQVCLGKFMIRHTKPAMAQPHASPPTGASARGRLADRFLLARRPVAGALAGRPASRRRGQLGARKDAKAGKRGPSWAHLGRASGALARPGAAGSEPRIAPCKWRPPKVSPEHSATRFGP